MRNQHDTLVKYFSEGCIASGAPSEITLYPIVDWGESDVWQYIRRHDILINPEYKHCKRVGCVICPKANLNKNYLALLEHPKLIDCIIKARRFEHCDWTSGNKDYSDNKPLYICRWLNHSFRPFTKRQEALANMVIENYNRQKNK